MPTCNIEQQQRQRILKQHDFTCQTCGAKSADIGGRELMRVGHIARNDESAKNSAADLKTLCPDCDDGFAAAKLLPRMNSRELLIQVRRATVADQIEVLKWLLTKYPKHITK